MVIHSLLLRSLHPHPGKGRDDQAIGLPPLLGRVGLMVMVIHMCLLRRSSPLLGKGRGGDHDQTQPSYSGGKRKG